MMRKLSSDIIDRLILTGMMFTRGKVIEIIHDVRRENWFNPYREINRKDMTAKSYGAGKVESEVVL